MNKEGSRLNMQARMNETFAASAIEECFNFEPIEKYLTILTEMLGSLEELL